MNILMLEDACGSVDGRFTTQYLKGHEYSVPDKLGQSFLDHKLASVVGVKMQKAPLNKAVTSDTYKNKSQDKS